VQVRAPGAFDEQLRMVAARSFRHRRRHRPQQLHTAGRLGQFAGFRQELQRSGSGRCLIAHSRKAAERRPAGLSPLLQCSARKAVVAFREQAQ